MSAKRIAVIGLKGLPATGGGARAGAAVIRRLSQRYRFTVFSMASHASQPEPLPGVRQVIIPSPGGHRAKLAAYYARSAAAVRLNNDEYDLVHLHHGMSGYVLPFLKGRLPTVITFRGHGPGIARDGRFGPVSRRVLLFGERLAVRFADEIVTVAAPHVSYYEAITRKPVHWIPNGVDPGIFSANETAPHDGTGDYIVFAAARIIPIKGCHLLLEAMRVARIDTKLLVIGNAGTDPAYTAQLRELADGLDVEFTGLISEESRLYELIRNARVFVFPSVTEAMSNMLLEAVMCGPPLVCSDIEANRSILKQHEAVFFESGSVPDLADRLGWAVNHYSELRQETLRARQRLRRELSWDRIAQSYQRVYDALLG